MCKPYFPSPLLAYAGKRLEKESGQVSGRFRRLFPTLENPWPASFNSRFLSHLVVSRPEAYAGHLVTTGASNPSTHLGTETLNSSFCAYSPPLQLSMVNTVPRHPFPFAPGWPIRPHVPFPSPAHSVV